MKNIRLGQKEIIHFIGIGGIGMSGLAQVMKTMGFKIQGSDQNKNKSTFNCSKAGIKVFIGHAKKNIKNATIVVKSSAIKDNNVEIKQAKKKKIPIYSRAEVLANVVSLKKNFFSLLRTHTPYFLIIISVASETREIEIFLLILFSDFFLES